MVLIISIGLNNVHNFCSWATDTLTKLYIQLIDG
ncbi:hypothetical protein MNBD_ALPHA11-2404 [hydrothermal vent metagenome]|uniref:Uncharacterized protein n=1 Tax=hydrothermal vent metagenome TaxID=652676 RepID=A0A3B0UQ12_9ZZZZ